MSLIGVPLILRTFFFTKERRELYFSLAEEDQFWPSLVHLIFSNILLMGHYRNTPIYPLNEYSLNRWFGARKYRLYWVIAELI